MIEKCELDKLCREALNMESIKKIHDETTKALHDSFKRNWKIAATVAIEKVFNEKPND